MQVVTNLDNVKIRTHNIWEGGRDRKWVSSFPHPKGGMIQYLSLRGGAWRELMRGYTQRAQHIVCPQ